MASLKRAIALALGAVAIVVFTMAFRVHRTSDARVVYTTRGELSAVHAEVRVAGEDVRGLRRLAANDRVVTGKDGRARVRLDDGTSLVLDRATELVVTDAGVSLDAGRIFAQGAPGSRTAVTVGALTVIVGTGTVALDRTDAIRVYCVAGEATLRGPEPDRHLHNGELATVTEKGVEIGPEKVWNDWTGGMARPWSGAGRPRGSIGELWGRAVSGPEDVGSPLATRSHEVTVTVVGEVATTESRTTYFNAGSSAVVGDFRMAIADDAIVSGFAAGTGDALSLASVRLGTDSASDLGTPRLEWAGEGWLRGRTSLIPPAESAVVVVRYVEWLSPAGGRMSYRYPMLGEGLAPTIGEFHARILVGGVDATAIGVPPDTQVEGDVIEARRADFRPTADLVVDFQLRPGSVDRARAYVVPGPEDAAGSFLLVRTEVAPGQPPRGTTLALVVDTSRSIDPSSLDAERGLVEALLEGLGKEDRVVVFAADDHAHAVGPSVMGPADEARGKAIRAALLELRPGGATDLGEALDRAADALPQGEPAATLIYIGDGWPTLGDLDVDAIRARLSRRAGGMPRLGAVAVGPLANRFGLTALVRGAGPVFSVEDRAGAAEVAVHLLADALQPSLAGVELDLGAEVERVYPRGARTVRTGETLTTVARMPALAPRTVDLRYRDGAEVRTEHRVLTSVPVVDEADVRRRWGAARVLELMLRGGGREAVVDAALQNGLLTPWTGWAIGIPGGASYRATPLWSRVLGTGQEGSLAVFSAGFVTPRPRAGALRAPRDEPWPIPSGNGPRDAWKVAAEAAARRTLEGATGSVRMCRESRAVLRPELGGELRVELSLAPDGHVVNVRVRGASPADDDSAVDRCVEEVIRSATFYTGNAGAAVAVVYEFHLPPARDVRAHGCSPTSSLQASMRRGVWFERLQRADSPTNPVGSRGERAYFHAKAACELPTWTDRRTFLELLLTRLDSGPARVDLAGLLDQGGDTDAADLVRREAVRRAGSPAELEAIRRAILANEPDVALPFVTEYAKATTSDARLGVVRSFLRLAPHDSRLRRKELALLSALGRKDELAAESVLVRQEPFLDAALLADTASLLRRAGAAEEAGRAFGELAERAPEVPFARALLGDRLRDEGLYDEATTAYEALLRLLPEDPSASFRLALANAGAGRLDLASRMLARVVETGGRSSDTDLQELAKITSMMLLADARATHLAPDVGARLARRALELPAIDASSLALFRAPTWVPGLAVTVTRGKGGADGDTLPVILAPSLGLAGLRFERGEGAVRFRMHRQADLEPAEPAVARLELLVPDGAGRASRRVEKEIPLRADGQDTEIVWDGVDLR